MFDYIKGILSYKTDIKGNYITLENNGTGYRFEIMERDYVILPELDAELKIFAVLIHREDKMSLCGFLKREDRDVFNILTSVSGVGTKMALTLLNSFEVSDLVGFVLEGNYKELTRAKGVGPKLAQKIILELKDKLTNYQDSKSISVKVNSGSVNSISSQDAQDARLVLLSLGYNKDEISQAFDKIMDLDIKKAPAEEILKQALKILSV